MLLLGGVLQASAQAQSLDAKLAISPFSATTIPIGGRTAAWVLIVPLFFLLLGALTRLVTRKMHLPEGGYAHTIRLYQWIAPLEKIAVLLFIVQQLPLLAIVSVPAYVTVGDMTLVLLLVCIFLRFEVKRALWAYPILYLRSFHDDATPFAFARIVAPIASRHGVLIGLVHRAQPAHVLQGKVSTLDRGGFVEASDDEWRNWVKLALAKARFVVIDVSHMTGNVEWELHTALEMVGHRRTLLLECRQPAGELQDRRPHRLSYSINRSQQRTVRRALRRWFSQAAQA